ncbi:Holliday junction resolvase RuvX [Candidatus Saccharibacteria bacterium]|nr:Holliday junction resolvase RuvX [Candidatus Saccharibacteria bacterium]
MNNHHNAVLALDVGERRIGVALADLQTRLPSPLTTLERSDSIFHDIHRLIDEYGVTVLVVGLPRGLDGQHTRQTVAVEEFKSDLERTLSIPVYWQDEALTSQLAEDELKARGRPYKKEDIDALSAAYILEDFLRDHPEVVL